LQSDWEASYIGWTVVPCVSNTARLTTLSANGRRSCRPLGRVSQKQMFMAYLAGKPIAHWGFPRSS